MEGFVSEEQLYIKKCRSRFHRIGLAFFAMTAVSYIAANLVATMWVIIETIITQGKPSAEFPSWFMWTATIVALYVCAAPVTYLILRLTLTAKAPERRRLNFRGFIIFLMIAFAMMIVGSYAGIILNGVLSLVTGGEQGGEVSDVLTNSDVWLSVLVTGVIAPIMEELFFRKLMIDRLHGIGDGMVMLLSGLVFGLFHGNVEQFCYAALLGALLAYVYLYTGNILYCIGIHAIINFFGGILPLLLEVIGEFAFAAIPNAELKDLAGMLLSLVAAAPMYIFAIAGLVLFIVYFGNLKRQLRPGEMLVPHGKAAGAMFGNVGVILFLVASGLQILQTIFV